jgi:hypothetical protein
VLKAIDKSKDIRSNWVVMIAQLLQINVKISKEMREQLLK